MFPAARVPRSGITIQTNEHFTKRRHSGLGIASCIAGIAIGFVMLGLFLSAHAVRETAAKPGVETTPIAYFVALSVVAAFVLNLVAIGLGIAGLLQKDRKRVFAILGTITSLLALVGAIAILIIANTQQSS